MISIVICSVSDFFARQVQENIDRTIGVEWEPIIINNSKTPKSITQVYNVGAAKARNHLICFVHEDVLFLTQDWGRKLLGYFENDKQLGLVGIAGCKYKSKTPSGWYTGISEIDCCNITHANRDNQLQKIYFNPLPGSSIQQVVVLDGVFLCCKKSVWEEVRFNEELLRDFHLYDLDFSLRVWEKYKVIVSYEINLIHIVKGMHYGDSWVENTLLWHKDIDGRIPASIPGIQLKKDKLETRIRKLWLIRLKHESIKLKNKLQWMKAIKIWRHISAWPYTVLFVIKSNKNK